MKEEGEQAKEEIHAELSQPRTIKSLVNTPFKKVMFGVQILSYVLIVASPLIGGAIGRVLGLTAAKTAGMILGVFIAGEVLFYGSLIFLGKEIVLLVRDKARGWFKKKSKD
jgi:vacuolar-type H+-ATPase subunit I/STV1